MAGTEKGKQIRRYFLDCEEQVKAAIADPVLALTDIVKEMRQEQLAHDRRIRTLEEQTTQISQPVKKVPKKRYRGNAFSPEGLKRLADLIVYCQDNDPEQQSNRATASILGCSASSVSNAKKSWERAEAGINHLVISQQMVRRFAVSGAVWIPFSDAQDMVTGEPLQRLYFEYEELRALCEGSIPLKTAVLHPLPPLARQVEDQRAALGHGYRQMCDRCFSTREPEMVNRLRKFLLLGGWTSDSEERNALRLAIDEYLGVKQRKRVVGEVPIKLAGWASTLDQRCNHNLVGL